MNAELTNNAAAQDKRLSTKRMLKRLIGKYLWPHKGKLAVAVFFMVIAAALTAGLAQLMQPVLDDVLVGAKKHMILPVGAAVFLTFFIRGGATYAHTLIMTKIGQLIVADLQKDLFSHFMTLNLDFFHAHPSGQLISRVTNDVGMVRLAIAETFLGVGKSLLTLIFLIGVMFYQDWRLTMAAFLVAPIIVLTVTRIGSRIRGVSRTVQNELAGLSDRLSQIFQGIRQVKAYSMEDTEAKRASGAIERVAKLNIKAVQIGNLSTPINEFLIGLVASAIIIYGGFQVADGVMTAGQLVAFLTAFTMAYEPMKKLAKMNNNIQTGLGAAESIFKMMDTIPAIKDAADATDLSLKAAPEIKFQFVSFRYEGAEEHALRDINFTAKKAGVTALVGGSGGGKSTVMNLIPRFYDVTEGAVLLDGRDIRDVTLKSLRKNIALVSQDITIFDDTIATNIAYGNPGAPVEDIQRAAKLAAAHDFIEEMSEGYDTVVGEDGVKLSGGQRQRIAIARAILHDAPILLLDEATSALDNESEKAVQSALRELEKGRTTIVIAHRLSTVRDADQIIVLDQGKILERGTHEELMDKNDHYARMVQAGLR
jgi:subfamily B ATP-binding cassette protein MsbA